MLPLAAGMYSKATVSVSKHPACVRLESTLTYLHLY